MNRSIQSQHVSDNPFFKILCSGIIVSFLVGMTAGWIRYWLGYFILVQGGVAGFIIAFTLNTFLWPSLNIRNERPSSGMFKLTVIWFIIFMAGQGTGFGFAQPWFDPLGWFLRVFEGKSSEYVFGIGATAGIHKPFAMGVKGIFWIILTGIDLAILFFFMLVLPWNDRNKKVIK